MIHSPLKALRQALFGLTSGNTGGRQKRSAGRHRPLAYESLESRELLAVVSLANMSVSENTGEKPQSKVWEQAGNWWAVMPKSDGTWVWRLDGTSWTPTLRLSTNNNVHADVKATAANLAHVLLLDGGSTQLASIEYVGGSTGYQFWSRRPNLVNIGIPSSNETATIDVDSFGRMWLAYDVSSTVEVRYSDDNYSTWSAPITVATGISSDDISVITAMAGGRMGLLWSSQSSDRFGFRTHQDGAAAEVWTANEVPASQSALNTGGGMADDHLNVKVASDGTLYAAVKTSYDSSSRPKIALLVRRANGNWDNLYQVDTSGTRPIVLVNEAAGRLIVAYTTSESGGNIVYKESPLGAISFGPRQTLLSGSLNNVTSTKQNFTGNIVVMAGGGSSARGALFSFNTVSLNQPPIVDAGPNRTVTLGNAASLDGTASDDGRPTPPSLTTTWSKFSGTGDVTFGNASAVDTTASFNAVGTYVLRLTASDGQLSTSDDVTVTVNDVTPPADEDPPAPGPGSGPTQIAFQDGLFPSLSYAGTRDTYISSSSTGTNYGTVTTLLIDGSPDLATLLKWDVSAIPAGSTVTSAVIELNVTDSSSGTYEVYALRRAWDELAANWQRYVTGQNWSTAGANNVNDRDPSALGTISPADTGIFRIVLNAAGIAAVQSWINNSAANFGVILQDYGTSSGADFSSSEATSASLRPKLIIGYDSASGNPGPPPVNQQPTVNAGPNRSIAFGTSASLDGTVSDDGLPAPPNLVATWSEVSGEGNVAIGSASSVDTTANFTEPGTYVLRLTVTDGALSAFDEMTVIVNPPDPGPGPDPDPGPSPGSGTLTEIAFQNGLFPSVTYAGMRDTYVSGGSSGSNFGNATTLLIDGSPDLAALLKWDVSAIPSDSNVNSAAIELNVTNTSSGNYEVYALQRAWDELSATWQQYAAGQNWATAGANNAADRATAVLGTVAPRNTGTYRIALNDAGVAAVQAWVNNASANHGVILQDYGVSNGADFQSSEVGTASQRPNLIISFTPPAAATAFAAFGASNPSPPVVNAGPNLTARLGTALALHGAASDDNVPPAALTTAWSKFSGTGNVTFADASMLDTTADFSAAGTYVLRLTAFDGLLTTFDELTVNVLPPLV
ncbi:MAG: DNRLRE domain-containing protein [Pirellulales bacterium]